MDMDKEIKQGSDLFFNFARILPKKLSITSGIIFLIILLIPSSMANQSQLGSAYKLIPSGSQVESLPSKEDLFNKDKALKDTRDLLEIITNFKNQDKIDINNEIRFYLRSNGYSESSEVKVLSEGALDMDILSALSVIYSNGQLYEKDGMLYNFSSAVMNGKEVNYKKELKNYILSYFAKGFRFYSWDLKKDSFGQVIKDEIIIEEKEKKTVSYYDPRFDEILEKEYFVTTTRKEVVVFPEVKATNTFTIENIFGIDLDSASPFEGLTNREAIKLTSDITNALLYGEGGVRKIYSSGLGGRFEWPAPENFKITSPFGSREYIEGAGSYHTGLDISCVIGSPVCSCEEGIVSYIGEDPFGYGNYVIVDHGNGITSLYAHLLRAQVRIGESVSKGSQIALSGNSGLSTGPHLHFEVRVGSVPENPLGWVK